MSGVTDWASSSFLAQTTTSRNSLAGCFPRKNSLWRRSSNLRSLKWSTPRSAWRFTIPSERRRRTVLRLWKTATATAANHQRAAKKGKNNIHSYREGYTGSVTNPCMNLSTHSTNQNLLCYSLGWNTCTLYWNRTVKQQQCSILPSWI